MSNQSFTEDSQGQEGLNIEQAIIGLVKRALVKNEGNRTHAARDLGIPVRTLRNWMIKYGLRSEYPSNGPGAGPIHPTTQEQPHA